MAALSDLLVKLSLDLSSFKAGFSEATRITDKIGKDLDNVANRLAKTGTALTASLTAPIMGAAAASLSLASDFESSLNRVSALGDITGDNLKKLRDQAIELGSKTKYSAQEAADGMAELAAKGFDTTKIMEAMPGILSLAATESMSVATASSIATAAMGQFGLATNDLNHIADVLAKGSSSTSASVQELGESLKLVGPVANLAGLSIEQTTAMVAKLSDAGIQGTEAGTGLRGTLASLLNPSKDVANQLAALGVSTRDASGNMRPFMSIMDDIKASGAGAGEIMNIFGRESASAAATLIGIGGPAIAEFTKQLENSDGAASKMAKTMNSGLKGAVEEMKGSIETAGIALGTVLAPYAEKLANIIQDLSGKVIDGINWFSKLPAPVHNVALALAAVAAAIGPVMLAAAGLSAGISALVTGWGAIVSAAGAASTTLGALSAVFAGVTLPATATVAAIAGVTAALVAFGVWVYSNWEPIKAVLVQAWDGIKEFWMAAWGPTIDLIVGLWKGTATTATSVFGALKAFLAPIFEPVVAAHVAAWNSLRSVLSAVWEGIKATALTVWGAIVSVIEGFLDVARKVPGVAKLLDLDKAWESAKKAADALKNTTTQVKALEAPVKATAKANDDLAKAHQNAGKAADGSAKSHEKLSTTKKQAADAAKKLATETHQYVQSANEAITNIERQQRGTLDLTAYQKQLNDATEQYNSKLLSQGLALGGTTAGVNSLIEHYKKELNELSNLQDAYSTLGVTSSASLEEKKNRAISAYETIRNSSTASALDIQAAWDAMNKASQEADGTTTSIFKTNVEQKKSAWTDFANQSRDILTRFSNDVVGALFENPGSIGEKFVGMLKNMGAALLNVFIEPATKALNDFMTGVIKDLLGGNGFGGLLDSLTKVGDKITDIFTNTGSASAGTGSTGGSSGSAGNAAGSAGSGVAGVVSAVAGVVTAVSSIIGNFQASETNKTLDRIVLHTLQTANDLANLRRDEFDREKHLLDKLDDIWRTIMEKSDMIAQSVYRMTDLIGARVDPIVDIRSIAGDMLGTLQSIASRGPSVEVTINNPLLTSDQSISALTQQISQTVAGQLRLQGVR